MKIFAWIFLASLTAAACGDSGGASSLPQAEACTQASQAACAKIYGCQQVIATALFGSQDACEASVVTSCGSTGFQCGANQTYHGDRAQMCKDQFTAMSCDTLLSLFPSLGASVTLGGAFAAITTSIPVCGQICTTP